MSFEDLKSKLLSNIRKQPAPPGPVEGSECWIWQRATVGIFGSELEAAQAYNNYIISHGLDRPLNNIEEDEEESIIGRLKWSTPTITEISEGEWLA